jgi:hypothetical protein
MRLTASRAATPDNQYGWGIVNALAAINYLSPSGAGSGQNPTSFALDQNYPNPFNPTTTIRFKVPSSTFVSLKVYDILGREVATLVDGMQQAGSHEVRFHADNLSSEVYFCRMNAGEFTATTKLLLAK